MMNRKVFGIGLNKTGTSTLGRAGEALGLKPKTWDAALFDEVIVKESRSALWDAIDANDLFNDFPYPLIYPELDARYPSAKFILTRRASANEWLASIKAHSMRASPATRTHKIVYGFQYPHGREAAFVDFYARHNAAAREYFRDRPDDFLEICWEEEPDWTRLARFLGAPAPEGPLPRANARRGKLVNPLRYAWNAGACLLQQVSRR